VRDRERHRDRVDIAIPERAVRGGRDDHGEETAHGCADPVDLCQAQLGVQHTNRVCSVLLVPVQRGVDEVVGVAAAGDVDGDDAGETTASAREFALVYTN
jgi:hypothetical protein